MVLYGQLDPFAFASDRSSLSLSTSSNLVDDAFLQVLFLSGFRIFKISATQQSIEK
jgi:hypothetical protein